MSLKVGGAVESLATDDTHEWTDGGVCETMTRQISRLTKRSSTLVARERFFSCMNSLSTTTSRGYITTTTISYTFAVFAIFVVIYYCRRLRQVHL